MDALILSIAANIVLGLMLFGMLYRKRGRDSDRLAGPEQALARYRVRYPAAKGWVSLAADGQAALLDLTDGGIGLVERCGRRWNVRTLEPKEIIGVARSRDGAITVRLADFGWPRARIQLSDPGIRQGWLERLGAMREAAVSERQRAASHA